MERLIELTDEEICMGFAASCVEAAAKRIGCSYSEMYQRMKRVDLINKYVIPYYDTIHTESRENITDNILECLENWEVRQGVADAESAKPYSLHHPQEGDSLC